MCEPGKLCGAVTVKRATWTEWVMWGVVIGLALSMIFLGFGCAGEALDDEPMGTVSQGWVAYSMNIGGGASQRWGVQQDANNSQCSSAIGANTACRFLTMQVASGSIHPTYTMATQTNFTAAERTIVNGLLDTINTGLNQRTGFPVNPPAAQVVGWVRQPDGSAAGMQVFKADFTSDGTNAMRNFVQVLHSTCGSDLAEGNPAINGKYRACKNATIGVDWDAVTAKFTTANPSDLTRARNQVLEHGVLMAMGFGAASAPDSYRNVVVVPTQNPASRLTNAELCMVNQFVDAPGDGSFDLGPFFHGSFVGC